MTYHHGSQTNHFQEIEISLDIFRRWWFYPFKFENLTAKVIKMLPLMNISDSPDSKFGSGSNPLI